MAEKVLITTNFFIEVGKELLKESRSRNEIESKIINDYFNKKYSKVLFRKKLIEK